MTLFLKKIIAFILAVCVMCLSAFAEMPDDNNEIRLIEGEQYTSVLSVANESNYMLIFEYYAGEGSRINPLLDIQLEGNGLSFSKQSEMFRIWQDIKTTERFDTDYRGNEIIPEQRQIFEWQKAEIIDCGAPFKLIPGDYKLTVTVLRDSISLKNIALSEHNEKTYQQYLEDTKTLDADTSSAEVIKIEAELTTAKSSSNIIPAYENSYSSISPSSADKIRLNILSGGSYADDGQWVEWDFDIKHSGYYSFDFRYRQDSVRGLGVRRKIHIDNEILFDSMNEYMFMYSDNFTSAPLKSGEELCKFYLAKGPHTLRLTAVLGSFEGYIDALESSVRDMSGVYRDIVAVTGYTPDIYRDYNLDSELPNLISDLEKIKSSIKTSADGIDAGSSGAKGSETAVMYETVRLIDSLMEKPEKIQTRTENFKSQIDALASLSQTLKKQPLELDYINIVPDGKRIPEVKQNFFKNLWFRLKVLYSSFKSDYNAADDTGKEPIKVWVSASDLMMASAASGREQAQILKRLCDQKFTPDSKIPVDISLVNTTDILTQAIVSGKGPDAAVFVPKQTVINLSARNALADMSKMPEFDTVKERFYPSAFVAYRYKSGVYALPQTQSFNMLFYRKDIFEELELKPPETWEEFYIILEFLQQRKMQVGIAENVQIFEMLLLQNGGKIYDEKLTKTQLSSSQSVKAFTDWTNLYLKYSTPLSFDFLNRFRVGEMPLGIAAYNMYNQLEVAAPEISGMWEMTAVPGIREEDGINRAESCVVNGTVVINGSKRVPDGYAFAKWFTSDEIQTDFGVQSEIIMGRSGRYNTANKQAFENLDWTAAEKTALKNQWEQVWDIPQTPATYYLNRSLTNAFRRAVYSFENQRDVIFRYGQEVDRELERKNAELG